jgi:hypothetical protein
VGDGFAAIVSKELAANVVRVEVYVEQEECWCDMFGWKEKGAQASGSWWPLRGFIFIKVTNREIIVGRIKLGKKGNK